MRVLMTAIGAAAMLAAGCAQQQATPAAQVTAGPASRADVVSAQAMLSTLGYRVGRPDGIEGPATRDAVRRFQTTRGLTATGAVDAPTLAALSDAVDAQGTAQGTARAQPARAAAQQARPAAQPAAQPAPTPTPVRAATPTPPELPRQNTNFQSGPAPESERDLFGGGGGGGWSG